MTDFSETRRQLLHMAMASFALLLRVLTWWQAALCAVAAFLFNLFVLPRIGGASLNRPRDAARGYPRGILFYPLSVLLLILAFPHRPDIVAAAWGILAFGDGAATIVGTSEPRTETAVESRQERRRIARLRGRRSGRGRGARVVDACRRVTAAARALHPGGPRPAAAAAAAASSPSPSASTTTSRSLSPRPSFSAVSG